MTLRSIFLHPLGPALVMALGGIALSLSYSLSFGPAVRAGYADTPIGRKKLARFRAVLVARSVFAFLTVFAAIWLLARLRVTPDRSGIAWVWQPLTVSGGALEWRADAWNWLVALLILLVTAAGLALVGSDWPEGPAYGRPGERLEWTLWLGAAALVFVFSANVITLVSAWILLDATIALRLRPAENPSASSQAWTLLSAAALVALLLVTVLGEDGIRSSLGEGTFSRLDISLLWFAALIRAGVYPLHYWLTGSPLRDPSDRVALHLIGPLAGLWLMARVHQISDIAQFSTPLWLALGTLALLGTALAAWTARNEALRWRWIMINRGSAILLMVYGASIAGPNAFVWQSITFALGGAMLALGQAARTGWRGAPLAWFAALVLWGLPGTVGFLARFELVYPTGSPLSIPTFFLVLVAEALLAAALWQATVGKPEDPNPDGRGANRYIPNGVMPAWYLFALVVGVFAALALLAVIWGIYPQRVAGLSPWPGSETVSGLWEYLKTTRRSVWFGLAVSGACGVILGWLRPRIFAGLRGWQELIFDVVNLDWLYRTAAGVVAFIGGGLRYFSTIGEGEGYIGWLLLASVVLWVLLRA
jgi:hypothetical protein